MKKLAALAFAFQVASMPALAELPAPPAQWLKCAIARADRAPVIPIDPDGIAPKDDKPSLRYEVAKTIVAACEPRGEETARRIIDREEITFRVIDRLSSRSRAWLSKAREDAVRRKSI